MQLAKFLYFLPLLLMTVPASAQHTADSLRIRIVDRLAESFPAGAEMSIALIDGEETRFLGYRKEADTLVTTDNRATAFSIGSVTKVFTATLLARAVEEGRLALSDSVAGAYDFPFADASNFTYAQLATHTSGLPRLPANLAVTFIDPYADYTPDRLTEYLRDGLTLAPEASMEYSNLGFGLLGYTLAHRLSGSGYAELLQGEIFGPLGMRRTSVGADSTLATVADPYSPDGTHPPRWHFTDAMAGAGAIYSTAEDLSRFLRAQLTGKDAAMALTRQPRLEQNPRQSVGLGWQIISPEPGRSIHWHNGAVAGYRSFVGIDVENGIGVVVLTNVLLMGQEVDGAGMQLLRSLGTQR